MVGSEGTGLLKAELADQWRAASSGGIWNPVRVELDLWSCGQDWVASGGCCRERLQQENPRRLQRAWGEEEKSAVSSSRSGSSSCKAGARGLPHDFVPRVGCQTMHLLNYSVSIKTWESDNRDKKLSGQRSRRKATSDLSLSFLHPKGPRPSLNPTLLHPVYLSSPCVYLPSVLQNCYG